MTVDPQGSRIPRPVPQASAVSGATLAETDQARLGPRASWRGRYVILRAHARGGLGIVSIALDETLGRKVALKQMRPDLADVPQFRERFIYEAEITGQLEHPGIIPIYALGQDESGRPYYAMKFVEGCTFDEAIAEHHAHPTPLALRDLLGRLVEICNAIAYAHDQGIIHRDIKPSNIMLGKFGETVILDWGLAKRIGAATHDQTIDGAAASGAATPGKPVGTPAFMPPEQAAGRADVGPPADVYSLGAVLYQLLCGQAPYAGEDSASVVAKVMQGPAPRPSLIKPVPRALEAVCMRALHRDARQRPAAAELAREIKRWLADEPLVSYRGTALDVMLRWARRHRTASVAAISVLIAIIMALSIGTVLITREKDAKDRALRDKQAALVRENEQRALAEQRERLARRSVYAADMRAAYEAWNDGDARRALQLLRAHVPDDPDEPDLRGFVWNYLFNEARGALIASVPIPGGCAAPAFSPDGKIVAVGSNDGVIHLVDVRAMRPLRTLISDSTPVLYLAFAPDGQTLACARGGTALQLFDVVSGQLRRTFDMGQTHPAWIAYSPDGALLASAVADGSVRVWDPRSGAPIANWSAHQSAALCCAFAPDGTYLASGGEDGAIRFWEPRSGRLLRTLATQTQPVRSLDFANDGRQLASANAWGAAVWDLQTGAELADHPHVGTVIHVAYTRDGTRLASRSAAGQINVLDLSGGGKTSFAQRSGEGTFALSPDGRFLAATDPPAEELELWDISGGSPRRIGDPAWHPASAVALGADGAIAIIGTSTGMIELWDTLTGRMIRRATIGAGVTALAMARESDVLAVGDDRGQLSIWSLASPTMRYQVPAHDEPIQSICISDDGGRIATASADKTVRLWDARGGGLQELFRGEGARIALTPDERHLAIGGDGKDAVCIVDLETGHTQPLHRETHRLVKALAFSRDGQRLVVGTEGFNALICYPRQPQRRPEHLQTERFTVTWVAFFPDGERLVTANPYGSIQFWDTVTQDECLTLQADADGRVPLAISGDGHMVASVSRDGSVALWRGPPRQTPP